MMDSIDDMINEGNNADEMARRKAMMDPQDVGDEYIDRIEGDTAVLMKNAPGGPTMRNVPRTALPNGAKEGDIIPGQAIGVTSLYGDQDTQEPDADPDDATMINSLYGARFPR